MTPAPASLEAGRVGGAPIRDPDELAAVARLLQAGQVKASLHPDLWKRVGTICEDALRATEPQGSRDAALKLNAELSRAGRDSPAKRKRAFGSQPPPGIEPNIIPGEEAMTSAMRDRDPIRTLQVALDTYRRSDQAAGMAPPSKRDLRELDEMVPGILPHSLVCHYARHGESQTETEKGIRTFRLLDGRDPSTGRPLEDHPRMVAAKARAARLWRDKLSFREIAKRLTAEGTKASHTKIRRWFGLVQRG